MSPMETKGGILIVGAGPAGMATAMELTKAGKTATIIERDERVGGLAQTLEFKEGNLTFRTDIGPHRFFSKNPYLYEFIENLINEKWITVKRQTRQFIDGKFYDYPINPTQALKNIGLVRAAGMMFSYALARIEYGLLYHPKTTFEDYIVANFGYALGSFNMLNYTEKIWGVPCSTLHPDWAAQRIKGLSIRAIVVSLVKKALGLGKRDEPKSLVDTFYYPQFGTGLIYETIAARVKEKGSDIRLNTEPRVIRHENGRITSLDLKGPEGLYRMEPEALVSSIPLTRFLDLLEPAPPSEVREAASKLRWRDQTYLFVTLDKERITGDQWIYFPDTKVPFGRVAEMKNFSDDMNPPGKTSWFIEFFVTRGDELWNTDKDRLFELAMPHIEKAGFFTRKDVRSYYKLERAHVYPIYDLEYPERLATVKRWLDTFENLHYIGRPGRFRYNNQDHSLEMGIAAAEGILKHVKPDFDAIGAEKEYYEKGKLREKKGEEKKPEGEPAHVSA